MQPKAFDRYLRQTILVPVVLLAVLAAILLWQISYMVSALRELDRTDRVIADARYLIQQALDMETGLRGYLLTGDTQFLEPYNRAIQQEAPVAAELQQFVAGDPVQMESVRRIQDRIAEWRQYGDSMIAARRGGVASVSSIQLNLEGKKRMDAIRGEADNLIRNAEITREKRTLGAQSATRTTLLTLGLLTAAAAIILVIVTRARTFALSDTYNRHLLAERQQADEAKANREWLLTTLRSIGEAVIATDPSGRIEFLNAAAEDVTGWKRNDARRRPVTDVLRTFDERTGEPIKDASEFVRLRQSQDVPRQVSVLERRDGERRVIDETAAPILDTHGGLLGIVVVFRDMTDARRAEAVLRSSERLALVGRLSATIAHEIQNPLDAVTNLLYLIENTEGLPESALEFSHLAKDEVSRISQITRQLLSFNREAREPVPVDLAEVIDSVIALFGPKLTSSGIRVVKDYETNKRVFGLPGELRQVFSNLIGNAMEATPKGGEIQVRVSDATDWRDSNRQGVRVVISDSGTGIPSAARSGLFTPFFTTKGEKGTGLGLWVSKGIVEKHEGSLKFRSSTHDGHRGTTFAVFLPLESTANARTGTAA